MYIQITTKCNMSCMHCCFSCKKELKGDYMNHETFYNAVNFAENYGEHIAIGGGEPTVHPDFFDFIDFALNWAENIDSVWLATNGKIKSKAMKIIQLMEEYGEERFAADLSLDIYHDPIDNEVVNAFKSIDRIRTVKEVINVGSAIENGIGEYDDCCCRSIFIKPNGDIRMCGCDDSLTIGNVNDEIDYDILSRAMQSDQIFSNGHYECGSDLNQEEIDFILNGAELKELSYV